LPRHILVFRFSALGDVAMVAPVLKLLLQQYPELNVTIVSTPMMRPIFEGIERLRFYPADIRGKLNSVSGLFSLSRQLKKDIPFDAIADVHDVLRTKLLRFFLIGKKVAVIDKGRKEKEELTRPVNKKLRPLKTAFQRYADVFAKIGFPINLDIRQGFLNLPVKRQVIPVDARGTRLIGIAPYARHSPKIYPLDKMREVAKLLAAEGNSIVLFGSPKEGIALEEWVATIPGVVNLAGKVSFDDELNAIALLDVMISMDSANMHLASLYGVPVISIWGGTHPYLGFYGWGQPIENAIQLDLPCRPSSVFGNKQCPVHGVSGCMQGITPSMIVEAVRNVKFKM
jgi:ADP-heptose:LPS heptosyltransferase